MFFMCAAPLLLLCRAPRWRSVFYPSVCSALSNCRCDAALTVCGCFYFLTLSLGCVHPLFPCARSCFSTPESLPAIAMALDPRDVYEFEMSHETGSSKNKLKVTTKFKASAACLFVAPRAAPRAPLLPRRRRRRSASQVERKYEPIKVLGHGAFGARAQPERAACK